ncbi:MAG: cytidine/deoxycytidylate deaminase family protein [Candidatus Magasanikbacteria bacterium]|nr:cytidine/deoxycytidylate deaminase family protein [Candidatus Magasanikbacteria bacterium]
MPTTQKHFRPSWDEYFMAIARIVATRASCDRLHAGAVLVKDKRIIASGYNGAPPGLPSCDEIGHLLEDGHCVRTIHAEHNVLLQVARLSGSSTEDSTLYATYSPCIHCAKYLVAAGIKRVVFGKVYRNSDVIEYLKSAGIDVDIYQENKDWLGQLQDLFSGEVDEKKAKEGKVKMKVVK